MFGKSERSETYVDLTTLSLLHTIHVHSSTPLKKVAPSTSERRKDDELRSPSSSIPECFIDFLIIQLLVNTPKL
jgi:hypothetical protein